MLMRTDTLLNRFILIQRLDRVPVDQEIETESNILLKDYKPSEMMGLARFKSMMAGQKDRHIQIQSPPVCKTGGLKISSEKLTFT